MEQTNISIFKEQKEFLKNKGINLSAFIRLKIQEEIEKDNSLNIIKNLSKENEILQEEREILKKNKEQEIKLKDTIKMFDEIDFKNKQAILSLDKLPESWANTEDIVFIMIKEAIDYIKSTYGYQIGMVDLIRYWKAKRLLK